jgi:oligosaccharide repeat unit polymerase
MTCVLTAAPIPHKHMSIHKLGIYPIAAFLIISILALSGSVSFATLNSVGIVMIIGLLVMQFRLDYRHPAVVFAAPWAVILALASVDLSLFARPLSLTTSYMLLAGVFLAFFTASLRMTPPRQDDASACPTTLVSTGRLHNCVMAGLAGFIALSALQIAISGYVPLIRGVMTGYSYYLTWGLSGVTGFYFAFGNTTATLAFIAWLLMKRRAYLLITLGIIVFYIMLVSRYNVICILVQCFAVFIVLRRRFRLTTVAGTVAALLFLFGLAGEWRSGDIKELAQVRNEYQWVPTAVVWFYSYSYFSVLNLDNAVTSPETPFYDGSAFTDILPNVLRPEYDHPDFLEIPIFNVATAYSPLYIDVGLWGALLIVAVMMGCSAKAFRGASQHPTLCNVGIYAVLYFAAMISFFISAWGYLPVMFQIPLFVIADRLVSTRLRLASLTSAPPQHEPDPYHA